MVPVSVKEGDLSSCLANLDIRRPTVRTPGGLRLSGNEILVKTFAEPGLQLFASRVFLPLTMRRDPTETEMKRMARWQLAAVAGFLLLYTIISLTAPRGFALTAFSDSCGLGLWLIAVAVMLWAAFSNRSEEHTSELQSHL